MSELASSAAAFRVWGDTLVPSEITALLGCQPTFSHSKGDTKTTGGGHIVTRKSGMWCLEAPDAKPGDIDAQILQVLAKLPDDLPMWRRLASTFSLDFYCGLVMGATNDGLSLSVRTLSALADRGIELQLDIYAPVAERFVETQP